MSNKQLFSAVPLVNGKTGEPPKQYVCNKCGALVLSRRKHYEWHKSLALNVASSIPTWHGVDD